MILPPIDESLTDKLIILKAARHPMPMASVSDEEREIFRAGTPVELPGFLEFLTKLEDTGSPHFTALWHYQHVSASDILEALGTFRTGNQAIELIDDQLLVPSPLGKENSCALREATLLLP